MEIEIKIILISILQAKKSARFYVYSYFQGIIFYLKSTIIGLGTRFKRSNCVQYNEQKQVSQNKEVQYLHFADNQNLTEGDKMSKTALLYEMLNRDIIQFGIFNKLSVDESMVPCFDWHSAKMFIKGKSIRFSFKIWYLCGSDSFSYNIKIYQGKEK